MTSENSASEGKRSYTSRLIEKLEALHTPIATINAIKDFAIEQYDAKQLKEAETAGIMNFGKYKGKKLADIAKLDAHYMLWLAKNCKYLSGTNQDLLKALTSV
jgi:uncharacterized protein (DUF3820 family)